MDFSTCGAGLISDGFPIGFCQCQEDVLIGIVRDLVVKKRNGADRLVGNDAVLAAAIDNRKVVTNILQVIVAGLNQNLSFAVSQAALTVLFDQQVSRRQELNFFVAGR